MYEYDNVFNRSVLHVNWKSAVHIPDRDHAKTPLCEHFVLLPSDGSPYHPVITPVDATIVAAPNSVHAFHTQSNTSKNHDDAGASGWVHVDAVGRVSMINYTGPILDERNIVVGLSDPAHGHVHPAEYTITSPPVNEIKMLVLTPPPQHPHTDCPSADTPINYTVATPVPLSQCDGFYDAVEEPHGTGQTGVYRYLQELPEQKGATWYNEEAHFGGGAYLDRDENEYTAFPGESFEMHPVARIVLAPHQNFERLGVAPAFIEVKFVFNRCKPTQFKCTIRAHELVPTPAQSIWWSDYNGEKEEVFSSVAAMFRDQGGHSWYKNGISIKSFPASDSTDYMDIFFAPYNSPYMLRISAYTRNSPADSVGSCDVAASDGCEPLPHDGWHDRKTNRGCTHYNNDKAMCSKGTYKHLTADAPSCDDDAAESCDQCYNDGTSFYDIAFQTCDKCNPGSLTHQRVTVMVDGFDRTYVPEFKAEFLVDYKFVRCTSDSYTDVDDFAGTDVFGLHKFVVDGVHASYMLFYSVKHERMKFTLQRPGFDDRAGRQTVLAAGPFNVTFDCYRSDVPTFENQCEAELLGDSITCADIKSKRDCDILEKKSRFCVIPPLPPLDTSLPESPLRCIPDAWPLLFKDMRKPSEIINSPEVDRQYSLEQVLIGDAERDQVLDFGNTFCKQKCYKHNCQMVFWLFQYPDLYCFYMDFTTTISYEILNGDEVVSGLCVS